MEDEALRNKMILLGSLISGIAHEINTPLAAIRSSNEVLQDVFDRLEAFVQGLPENQRKSGSIEGVLSLARDTFNVQGLACERLDGIARSVRNFMRSDGQTWTKTSLQEVLENALVLTAHLLRGRIAVSKEFSDACEVECHPNQLGQVFINLLVNAAQAIEGTGEIRIRTRQEGGMAVVSISDSGSGMTPEVQARIFEAGFTTKPKGVGTGLGLWISLKTVQAHGGRIEVESRPAPEADHGSTFVVFMPLTQPPERTMNGER